MMFVRNNKKIFNKHFPLDFFHSVLDWIVNTGTHKLIVKKLTSALMMIP